MNTINRTQKLTFSLISLAKLIFLRSSSICFLFICPTFVNRICSAFDNFGSPPGFCDPEIATVIQIAKNDQNIPFLPFPPFSGADFCAPFTLPGCFCCCSVSESPSTGIRGVLAKSTRKSFPRPSRESAKFWYLNRNNFIECKLGYMQQAPKFW